MYTLPSNIQESMLLRITKEDLSELELLPKEIKNMEFCNLGTDELEGYYYDKEGNIYLDHTLRFYLKIKYFKKIYKKDIPETVLT